MLLATVRVAQPTGTATYTRDVALALAARGYDVSVFALASGEMAAELRERGISVSRRLSSFERPDIIHGNHRAPTLAALAHWPGVPAISVCHDHLANGSRTPLHSRILAWFAVSRVCRQRLLREGAPADRVGYLLNFVDTHRFAPRGPLPQQPRDALVFSNYATDRTQLPAIRHACEMAGLRLHVMGAGAGTMETNPERILGAYDVVFAKGKAAMEAMAVGCAVILCDFAGAGPLVTSGDFDRLRPMNFGFEALTNPLHDARLLEQIRRYDPTDAERVRDRIREEASPESFIDQLVAAYTRVVAEWQRSPRTDTIGDATRVMRARLAVAMVRTWHSIPDRRRETIAMLPVLRALKRVAARIVAMS